MGRTLAAMALAVALALPGWARAQQDERGFSVQNFRAAPGYGSFLTVEGAEVPAGLALRLGAMADYQYDPLLIRGCDKVEGGRCTKWSDSETALVRHHLTLEALGAVGVFRIFEAGVAIPAVLYQAGDDVKPGSSAIGVKSPDSVAGLEDIRLHLKLDVLHGLAGYKGDDFGVAIVPVITFPVGNAVSGGSFMGDSFITVHPKAVFGARLGRVRLGLDAGYVWRETKHFYMADVGPRITYGAAAEIGIIERLSGVIELFGQNAFTSDLTSSPLEGDGALRFEIDKGLAVTAGAGAGILAGVGSPLFRVFGGVMWSPVIERDRDGDRVLDDDDQCPDVPEDIDWFEDSDGCPDPDNDGDGIPDAQDRCPNDPEDKDGFEDKDGCPDPDNDGDGIADRDDKCPGEAEDEDRFEDEDGCPDLDNDKDGIADKDDKCPNEAEDKDRFEDEDGCPDLDNDKDGIADKDDKCPNEAEVFNGVDDLDGCPDQGKALVEVTEQQIEIMQKVNFRTDSDEIVKKESFDTLNTVVAILKTRPTMKVRIEGHTDAQGSRDHNLDLSLRRARQVMKYLVDNGIDPERLEAAGLGPDKPIDTNSTAAGRATNRRVEFHITAR